MAIAYLYKYALTSGVIAVDTSSFKESPSGDGYLFGPWLKGGLSQVMKEGRDFSYSLDEAKGKFDEMVERKVDSLIRQQSKLQSKVFKIVDTY